MVLIANPLYDVVFKYLLEDKESARILLSTLIEEEIVELEPRPHELLLELESRSLTVFRLDFSAKIKTVTGTFKLVILEIQKAKLPSDIMRFRRYLGKQYIHKENVYTTQSGEVRPLPIVSIYFLAFGLPELDCPVVEVKRQYRNARTKAPIPVTTPFLEGLTHDAYVVQLGKLGEPYESEAERLLRIFDQHNRNKADGGRSLRMDDARYPAQYMRLKDRLVRAMADEDLRDQMDLEEDILEDLERLERTVDQKEKALEEKTQALEEKEKLVAHQGKALEENAEALEEKDKALAQKDQRLDDLAQALAEQTRALAEQTRALAEQAQMIEQLKQALLKPSST